MHLNITDFLTTNTPIDSAGTYDGMTYLIAYSHHYSWINVVRGFNAFGLTISIITLVLVLSRFRHREFKEVISFRLSATIAFGDILCSMASLMLSSSALIKSASERTMRGIFWLWFLGIGLMTIATACIATDLYLAVIRRFTRLAKFIGRWYELVTFTLAIVITQPVLYMYITLVYVPQAQSLIIFDHSAKSIRTKAWLIYIWIVIAILWCLIVSAMVAAKVFPIWKRATGDSFNIISSSEGIVNNPEPTPHQYAMQTQPARGRTDLRLLDGDYNNGPVGKCVPGGCGLGYDDDDKDIIHPQLSQTQLYQRPQPQVRHQAPPAAHQNSTKSTSYRTSGHIPAAYLLRTQHADGCRPQLPSYIKRRKRDVQLIMLRLFLYPIVPIITTPWVVIYHTRVSKGASTFGFVVLLMICMQGIFSFVVFLCNPALDIYWGRVNYHKYRLKNWCKRRLGRDTDGGASRHAITGNTTMLSTDTQTAVSPGQTPALHSIGIDTHDKKYHPAIAMELGTPTTLKSSLTMRDADLAECNNGNSSLLKGSTQQTQMLVLSMPTSARSHEGERDEEFGALGDSGNQTTHHINRLSSRPTNQAFSFNMDDDDGDNGDIHKYRRNII